MSILNGLPVNFTISKDALATIEQLRAHYKSVSPSDGDVVCVGWGFFKPKGFADFQAPVVGFYSERDREWMADGIERVSGIEVFFFILEEHYGYFESKVIDFSDERGFFLREP